MMRYLSRLRLSDAPSAKALDSLLNPADPGRRLDAHHKLLWAVFSDGPDRRRDFLWRDEGGGRFLTLSARQPAVSELFAAPEVKVFAPDLAAGDRLVFSLRANATRTGKTDGRSINGNPQKRHIDLVMDALHAIPGRKDLPEGTDSLRAPKRMGLAQTAATTWLDGQGGRAGFRLIRAEVGDYSVLALPGFRGPRGGQPQFGILELTGLLEVTDAAAFTARVTAGFGRAKAFGCGLMLIRRAG